MLDKYTLYLKVILLHIYSTLISLWYLLVVFTIKSKDNEYYLNKQVQLVFGHLHLSKLWRKRMNDTNAP